MINSLIACCCRARRGVDRLHSLGRGVFPHEHRQVPRETRSARIAGDGGPITETGLQRWSLDLFPAASRLQRFRSCTCPLRIIEGITLLMVACERA